MWLASGTSNSKLAPASASATYVELMNKLLGDASAPFGVFYASLSHAYVDTCSSSGMSGACTNHVAKKWNDFVQVVCDAGYSQCSAFETYRDAIAGLHIVAVFSLVFGVLSAITWALFMAYACQFCATVPDSQREYASYVSLSRFLVFHCLLVCLAAVFACGVTIQYQANQNVSALTPGSGSRNGGIRDGPGFSLAAASCGMFGVALLVDLIALKLSSVYRGKHPKIDSSDLPTTQQTADSAIPKSPAVDVGFPTTAGSTNPYFSTSEYHPSQQHQAPAVVGPHPSAPAWSHVEPAYVAQPKVVIYSDDARSGYAHSTIESF
eukprot:ANDGO_06871.mRNA.1 hypothetical protein